MSHTFLSLDMSLIPQSTKDNVPTFYSGMFSNDNSKMLIDGKNANGEMVHPLAVLRAWTQWSINSDEVIQDLLNSAIEYTAEQIQTEQQDAASIWYVEQEVLI